MDFSLTQEQQIFENSVARFVAEEYDFIKRQRIVSNEPGYLPEHWAKFAELGWLAAPFPEEYDGLGGSTVETMLLMQQFGRGLVASPYLSSVVLSGQLVLQAGSDEQKRELLTPLCTGELKLAFAFAEPQSRYELNDVATSATRDGDSFTINGRKSVVFHCESADKLIVCCRTSGQQRDGAGLSLFLVDTDATGLSARHYPTQDGGRASEVTFDNVRVGREQLLGEPDAALPVIENAIDHGIAAICAEASGAMWSIYEQTLEYLKTREQFGQPLGKFQALQHRMVDVYMKCELAQSLAYDATLNLDNPDAAQRRRAVSGAKVEIAGHGRAVGQEGVQLHGGMGMTMDLPIGHYFKRLTMINATFGDADYHLRRYRECGANG